MTKQVRYIALYLHKEDGKEHKRKHIHIYAETMARAVAKWSEVSSAGEKLVHLVANPTASQAWDFYDNRRYDQ